MYTVCNSVFRERKVTINLIVNCLSKAKFNPYNSIITCHLHDHTHIVRFLLLREFEVDRRMRQCTLYATVNSVKERLPLT